MAEKEVRIYYSKVKKIWLKKVNNLKSQIFLSKNKFPCSLLDFEELRCILSCL